MIKVTCLVIVWRDHSGGEPILNYWISSKESAGAILDMEIKFCSGLIYGRMTVSEINSLI
jgi:hypothetical protein